MFLFVVFGLMYLWYILYVNKEETVICSVEFVDMMVMKSMMVIVVVLFLFIKWVVMVGGMRFLLVLLEVIGKLRVMVVRFMVVVRVKGMVN